MVPGPDEADRLMGDATCGKCGEVTRLIRDLGEPVVVGRAYTLMGECRKCGNPLSADVGLMRVPRRGGQG